MAGNLNCPFCHTEKADISLKNGFWYARWDKYPVNPGHLLIITFRHVSSYFDATQYEKQALVDSVEECRRLVDRKFSPSGYNIGVNVGPIAGQTVMHLHVHLIPRYKGDLRDPRGGVRGVIPKKRIYKSALGK